MAPASQIPEIKLHTNTNTRTSTHGSPAAQGRFNQWLTTSFRRWQKHRTTAALQQLDDRMLADIGLQREDIPSMATLLTGRERGATPRPQDGTMRLAA